MTSLIYAFVSTALALEPRAPLPPMHIEALPLPEGSPVADWRLTVKFRDEVLARADEGEVTLDPGAERGRIDEVIAEHGLSFEQLIALPDDRIEALEARAEARSGIEQPDLRGMMAVEVASHDPYLPLPHDLHPRAA